MKQPTLLLTLLAPLAFVAATTGVRVPTSSSRRRGTTVEAGPARRPSPRCKKPGTPPAERRSPLPFIWRAARITCPKRWCSGRKIPGLPGRPTKVKPRSSAAG